MNSIIWHACLTFAYIHTTIKNGIHLCRKHTVFVSLFLQMSLEYTFLFLFQAKELQTLHNLRKLFVQDLATRVKKVSIHRMTGSLPRNIYVCREEL